MNTVSRTRAISLVPLMVQSDISMPFAASSQASAFDITGSAVEASSRTRPGRPVSNSLSEFLTTSATMCEFGSDRMITSTCAAIRSGEATLLPPAATIASTLAGSRSCAITE